MIQNIIYSSTTQHCGKDTKSMMDKSHGGGCIPAVKSVGQAEPGLRNNNDK